MMNRNPRGQGDQHHFRRGRQPNQHYNNQSLVLDLHANLHQRESSDESDRDSEQNFRYSRIQWRSRTQDYESDCYSDRSRSLYEQRNSATQDYDTDWYSDRSRSLYDQRNSANQQPKWRNQPQYDRGDGQEQNWRDRSQRHGQRHTSTYFRRKPFRPKENSNYKKMSGKASNIDDRDDTVLSNRFAKDVNILNNEWDTQPKCSKDRLSTFRSYRENYESMLKTLSPSDIILECRQELDELAKDCITQNLKNIEHISKQLLSIKNNSILDLHRKNLLLQQSQFDGYVAKIKEELASVFTSDIQELLKLIDKIKEKVQKQCRLFKRTLPSYAYKSSIVDKVRGNQVVILQSDSTYFLNILIPAIMQDEFPNHLIFCCETTEVLRTTLERNVSNLLFDNIPDDATEKKSEIDISFKTESEMLGYFGDSSCSFSEKPIICIINLPLKRTLELDIILANLKDLLLEQQECKLILLASDCDRFKKYETYFGDELDVSVMQFPSLLFPTTTIWKKSPLIPADNYVEEVVKTIISIHTLKESGDIMAFLPTFSDAQSVSVIVKKECANLQYDNLVCILVHETSTSKHCSFDLFSKKETDKRVVFLVTDCADKLIIPSVCFIIDVGLKKEYMFDADKKLDVLTTTFISHDKAKLRKSLASIFKSGACFHLYNKENYNKEMPQKEFSELFTVDPFNSMIKIFQHRPLTATTTSFVESLPEATRQNALISLKKYNAVKDNALTELGKNIIKLPFPVRYSKLLLVGIEWGLSFEVTVLVAFFLVKGRVFQYSVDVESQRDVDASKLQLLHGDSDTLSYLHIYKVWLDNNYDESWCKKHHINYDTLKNVHSKVNEICQIIGNSLNEDVSQEFANFKECSETLLELLFQCFQDNLCVFTGHNKSGYRVLSSQCIAFLHPSSIICQMEQPPQFIIFDHILSTSRDFLFCITAVPEHLVEKAIEEQIIEYDRSDLFETILTRRVIEPIGERIIKQVLLGKKGKKLKQIEDEIRIKLKTESLVIEPIVDRSCVHVYALEIYIEEAVRLVNDILNEQYKEMCDAEQSHNVELKRGNIKIPVELKLLKGAQIASIKVGKLQQSSIASVSISGNEDNATDELPCVIQRSLNITWMRRSCNGKGYASFKSTDFPMARKLCMQSLNFYDTEIFIQLSKLKENQLFISQIPPDAKCSDLEELLCRWLRGIKPEVVELKYTPPFATSEEELESIKKDIKECCTGHTGLSNFDVVIPTPKDSATIMKAYVNISSDEDLERHANALRGHRIKDLKMDVKPVYRLIIKCSLDICQALATRFKNSLTNLESDLKEHFSNEELFEVDIKKLSDNMAAIKMLSNHFVILQRLQTTVNSLLEGEVLNNTFSSKLNKIFCRGGHLWLRTLERSNNIHIIEDYINKSLRLYGSEENCRYCKHRIGQFLEDTENEAVKVVSLSGEKGNRKLLKAIIIEYGANLEKYIESCQLQSALLDIKSCSLSLHGSRDAINKAEDVLKQLASGLDETSLSGVLSNEETCPICTCPALNLTNRLELCGHLYCFECVQGLVDQAEFPIQCCAEDCYKEVILDDIFKILDDDPERVKALLEKALNQYIQEHQAEIFHCPAPDCSMFFQKKEIANDKLSCPLCQNEICVKCNVVFHQGYTCDVYQGSKKDPDYSFKVWQQNTAQCKQCPKCNSAIQKNEGCDHMFCIYCKSHFCWQCLRLFPDGSATGAHVPYCDRYPRW